MVLIRMLTLRGLEANTRIFAKWIKGSNNGLSDALSRQKFDKFEHLAMKQGIKIDKSPTPLLKEMWPPGKIWID